MNHSGLRTTTMLLTFAVIIGITTCWNSAFAINRQGRLGIGLNQQLVNNLPAISIKLQKSNT
ncbi:MAG: hypothetical protein HN730_13660, partial [Bdellovibrionales bacterium]|nr:hypothetical protein [Bdellovibrionales bacterium]